MVNNRYKFYYKQRITIVYPTEKYVVGKLGHNLLGNTTMLGIMLGRLSYTLRQIVVLMCTFYAD